MHLHFLRAGDRSKETEARSRGRQCRSGFHSRRVRSPFTWHLAPDTWRHFFLPFVFINTSGCTFSFEMVHGGRRGAKSLRLGGRRHKAGQSSIRSRQNRDQCSSPSSWVLKTRKFQQPTQSFQTLLGISPHTPFVQSSLDPPSVVPHRLAWHFGCRLCTKLRTLLEKCRIQNRRILTRTFVRRHPGSTFVKLSCCRREAMRPQGACRPQG